MRDLRIDIQDRLLYGESSVNQIHRKLNANKTNFTQTWKKMEKDGIIKREKRGNRIYLSLINPRPKLSSYLESFDSRLKWFKKIARKQLKLLRENKPLFLDYQELEYPLPDPHKKGKTIIARSMSYKINPQQKGNFNSLIGLLNNVFGYSTSLTYAEALGIIPKQYSRTIQRYQRKCIQLIQEIIGELVKQHKGQKNELLIKHHLSYKLQGYQHLQEMEQTLG